MSMLLNTKTLHMVGRKEGRKEMFYLTTHSTHFIYSYMAIGHMVKEGRNVLFNNTFYLQLYGIDIW